MSPPLSPSYGDRNTISGWRCRLLEVPALSCSFRRPVCGAVPSVAVALACRRGAGVVASVCRRGVGVVIIVSSFCRCLLAPCLSSRSCEPWVRRRCYRFAPLRVPCCLPYRPGGSGGGVLISLLCSSCLPALRWCRIAHLPVSSTRRARRWCFGVPATEWSFSSVSHRFLIGVGARFGFACSFYPYRRRIVPTM